MKNILILGAGESGIGSALLAKEKNWNVLVFDNNVIAPSYRNELVAHDITFVERSYQDSIFNVSLVVKSPGIARNAPIVQEIKKTGIPIIGEIEFASRYTDAKLIGITGSNGKSTVTKLTHHLLSQFGMNIGIAGNIGKSFARSILEKSREYFVLELSNFQLQDMYECKLDIACLLNITPDHMDAYNYKMQPYICDKFRILQNMTHNDYFIYNQGDENIAKYLHSYVNLPKLCPIAEQEVFQIKRTLPETLIGYHNAFNATVAMKVAQLLKAPKRSIEIALSTFKPLEHRIELVAQINGVSFYNDSKATNVESVYNAINSFDSPIIWIAGGKDKGNDYSLLKPLVKSKVMAMICIGKDNGALKSNFKDSIPLIYETQCMNDVVEKALTWAHSGYVVLLSPACASFDLFKNFEHRGDEFKKSVNTKALSLLSL